MKKIIIILGITVIFLTIAVIGIGYWMILTLPPQKIIFTNNSNFSVASTEIKYCNEIIYLKSIKSRESISKDLKRAGDCDFDIKIIFSDDSVIEKNNLGYITNYDGSKSIFVVSEQKELNFLQEH